MNWLRDTLLGQIILGVLINALYSQVFDLHPHLLTLTLGGVMAVLLLSGHTWGWFPTTWIRFSTALALVLLSFFPAEVQSAGHASWAALAQLIRAKVPAGLFLALVLVVSSPIGVGVWLLRRGGYRRDVFFHVIWYWRWEDGRPVDLVARCPDCLRRLELRQDVLYSPVGAPGRGGAALVCPTDEIVYPVPGYKNSEELLAAVAGLIDQRWHTGEWRKAAGRVRRQRTAPGPGKNPSKPR